MPRHMIPFITPTRKARPDSFVLIQSARFLIRHLERYGVPDCETLSLTCWLLEDEVQGILQKLDRLLKASDRKALSREIETSDTPAEDFPRVMAKYCQRLGGGRCRFVLKACCEELDALVNRLCALGKSESEINIEKLRRMFHLSELEVRFCNLLFINTASEEAETFFVTHLQCNQLSGYRYLLNLLRAGPEEVNAVLNGTLKAVDLIDMDRSDLRIKDDFWPLFLNPSPQCLGERYFRPALRSDVPLDHHFVPVGHRAHAERLLAEKPASSTHLLLYGPPGSGKTSFALGITAGTGAPVYEIVRGEENRAAARRAAIVACLNLTNIGDGAIIVVDEADNLLNTDSAWQMRGEIHDKGYLNQLLETPGARIVWIVNQIDDIDPSVMRRFAFSIKFRPFNRRQRCLLWDRILRKHRMKRHFNEAEIAELAARYPVSAGAVDLALTKAVESGYRKKAALREFIEAALTVHRTLVQKGAAITDKDRLPEGYVIEGLNTDIGLDQLLSSASRFDQVLTSGQEEGPLHLNLLFHGPPGTGKSAFARYLAEKLQRGCQCRRMSDLLDPFVGVTERNIREAFERAETEEAVLVMDEVDSLLFSRDRAQRSWEVSHTNEFLTGMERFRGLLICTTNRFEDLDAASIRRFNHKVRFDYLTPEGNVLFYRRCLAPIIDEKIHDKLLKELRSLKTLAPGDFGLVKQQFRFFQKSELSHEAVLKALRREACLKRKNHGKEKIGF